jgi:hypothetical protein
VVVVLKAIERDQTYNKSTVYTKDAAVKCISRLPWF